MTATRVTCPECGATIDATGDAVKCEYCGTTARVQRRTTVFEIPQRMKPTEAHHPKPIARQVRQRTWPIVVLLLAVIAFPIAIVASVAISQSRRFLIDGYLRVADVDGDGTADVIVWTRWLKKDQMKLRAVSGVDGHTIWETGSLGSYIDSYRSAFAIANGVLIRTSEKSTQIDAFELKTGQKLWTVNTQEAAEYSCDAGPTVVLADKTVFAIDTKTGALTPGTDPCGKRDDALEYKLRAFPITGLSWERFYGDHAPYVVSGEKQPGTAIPTIAAIDDTTGLVWHDNIASHDPMKSRHGSVQVRDDIAAGVIAWDNDHQSPEVSAFDRKTGKRLWTQTVKYTGRMFIEMHGIGIGANLVIVAINASLQGFDPKTGARRFVVGETD